MGLQGSTGLGSPHTSVKTGSESSPGPLAGRLLGPLGGQRTKDRAMGQEEILALGTDAFAHPSLITVRKFGLLSIVTSSLKGERTVTGRSCVLGAFQGLGA